MEMHRTKNRKGGKEVVEVLADIRAFCNRKYMSDFSLEMNRSVAEYLKRCKYE